MPAFALRLQAAPRPHKKLGWREREGERLPPHPAAPLPRQPLPPGTPWCYLSQGEELLQRALGVAQKYNGESSIQEMNVLSALAQHYRWAAGRGGRGLACASCIRIVWGCPGSVGPACVCCPALHCSFLWFAAVCGGHSGLCSTPHGAPRRRREKLNEAIELYERVLAIMDERIQVYDPDMLRDRVAILRWEGRAGLCYCLWGRQGLWVISGQWCCLRGPQREAHQRLSLQRGPCPLALLALQARR